MSYNHYDSIHNDPDYPDENIGGCNCGPRPPQPPYAPYYPNYLYYPYFSYYQNGNPGGYNYGSQAPHYPEEKPDNYNYGSIPPHYPNNNSGACNCGSRPPQPPDYRDENFGGYHNEPPPPPQYPGENPVGYNYGSMPLQPPLDPEENIGGWNNGAQSPDYPDENLGSYNDGPISPQPPLFPDENPGGCNCGHKPPSPHPPFPPFPPFPFCDKRDEKDPPHRCPHKHHKNDGMICCPGPRNCVHQEICQRFCINDFAKLCKVEVKGTAIHNCDAKICLSYKIFVEYLDCCGHHKTFCRSAMVQFCQPLKCSPHEYYRINIKNPPKVEVCGKQLTVRTSAGICCQS